MAALKIQVGAQIASARADVQLRKTAADARVIRITRGRRETEGLENRSLDTATKKGSRKRRVSGTGSIVAIPAITAGEERIARVGNHPERPKASPRAIDSPSIQTIEPKICPIGIEPVKTEHI
jgi:hypothetical protein